MFGQINSEDSRVTPFAVHKQFTVTFYDGVDTATRLGVMPLRAESGSLSGNPAFNTGSAAANTFTSGGASYKFYNRPLFEQIKRNFFHFANAPNNHSETNSQPQFTLDRHFKPWGNGKSKNNQYYWEILGLRKLHNAVNVISIPQKLFGEGIKSGSIELTDYSKGAAITVKDDGYGNLYDATYETNFLSASLTAQGSGSSIGVVSYDYGLIMLTDTGSMYGNVGKMTGANGWVLKFDSTKTIYEHEYSVVIPEGRFNSTTNISVSLERSGSQTIPSGLDDGTMRELVAAPAESLYNSNGYNATTQTENFTTHSFFAPYVTTIGLYNDHGDLLAVAKTSRPVRNDPEIALSFIVRFDI